MKVIPPPPQQMKKKKQKRNNLVVEGEVDQEVIDLDNFWFFILSNVFLFLSY